MSTGQSLLYRGITSYCNPVIGGKGLGPNAEKRINESAKISIWSFFAIFVYLTHLTETILALSLW